MLRCLILLFAAVWSINGLAQTGAVSGIVRDAQGEPLPGVSVVVGSVGDYTATDGRYTIELTAGDHTVVFSYVGYETEKRTVEVTSGQTLSLDIVLEQATAGLDIAVISASRYEQRLEEVTVSMEVLKPAIIENKNINDISDLIQQTPGVSVVDEEPQIRATSGYSFGAGSRVMVMVDGLPILSGDAGRPTWRFLPMENVNQVEVIKGASSVLYGSAAMGGVIHLRTAYPGDEPRTRVTSYAGVYSDPETTASKYWSRNALRLGINALHSQKIGQLDLVVGSNAYIDEEHLGPIEEEKPFNPTRVNRFSGEARARANVNLRYRHPAISGLSFGVNTNWMQSESLATLLWDNVDDGLYRALDGSATRTKQLIGNVDPFISYNNGKGANHQLLMRWQSLDNDNDNDQSNFSDVYYANYVFTKEFNPQWTLTTGLAANFTEGTSDLYNGGESNGENSASNQAAFAQLDATFFEKLRISSGVRYEYFEINGEDSSKPIFRAGLNYQAGRATYVRASFGQGFRFPTIAEKFLQTEVGEIIIYPNEGLQEETSHAYEIGVKQGFKLGRVKGFLDVALFRQEYQNFVEFTFGQWDSVPSFENTLGLGFRSLNTGNSTIQGVEVSFSGIAEWENASLTFFGGYTYSSPRTNDKDFVYANSEVDPENPLGLNVFKELTYATTSSDDSGVLKYRLEHLVRFDAQFMYKQYGLGASIRYNSRMRNIDQIFLDLDSPDFILPVFTGINQWREEHQTGDAVIDLRLMYQVSDHWRVALLGENVLNREYAIRPLVIEPGRVTSIQLTFTH